jgi:hypothetical protein
LPELRAWRRCLDTALPSPDDIVPMEDAPFVEQPHYVVQPHSMVILGAMAEGT